MLFKGSIDRYEFGLHQDALGKVATGWPKQSGEDPKAAMQPRSLSPKKASMTYAGEREASQAPEYTVG